MPTTALITPSYFGDLERCRLLCETIDRHLPPNTQHYILVDPSDLGLFAGLAGPRRTIVDERDILPHRLPYLRQGPGREARKVWFGWARGPRLLRGWHVQQLRRIAIAHHVDADGLLYCDSDMAFVRDFDPADLWRGYALRLYRVPDGINRDLADGGREQIEWTRWAAMLLGLPAPDIPADDYINNLVSWRADHVRAMCAHIENTHEMDWMRALYRQRAFSECQIYGAYANDLLGQAGHWGTNAALCRTVWFGDRFQERELRELVGKLDPEQVAIGVQSFMQTDPAVIRRVLVAEGSL